MSEVQSERLMIDMLRRLYGVHEVHVCMMICSMIPQAWRWGLHMELVLCGNSQSLLASNASHISGLLTLYYLAMLDAKLITHQHSSSC